MKELKAIKLVGWIKFGFYFLFILLIYHSTLIYLISEDWQREAYSYGFLIPFVVLYLIWIKRDELASLPSTHSWNGFILIILGLLFFLLGELSGEYLTLYLSFWLILVGLCWLHLGWQKLKHIGFALFFMLTMFPLPYFLNTKLMLTLRLISSQLGVYIIQLAGLPVNREGNIIDLGFIQLQVVEACSGLHSLISLLVLCLLIVYFFKAHIWKRIFLLLSSIPLAIFTNSMRIAMTAILYKYFGSVVAQGFFHGFSGLAIFIICIPLLLIEMTILEKLPPDSQKSSSKLTVSGSKSLSHDTSPQANNISFRAALRQPIFIATVILLVATFAISHSIEFREKIPVKKSLNNFPMKFSGWVSNGPQSLDQIFIDELNFSEYTMADFKNKDGQTVSLYLVYYESQNKGQSIHSPASCLPGSGWSFDQTGTVNIPGASRTMQVNRAVMQYSGSKQLAYYWFSQRGRILNNAYQLKIYNFWDTLIMQRTDGALIRLITPVYENEKLGDADARLEGFVRDIVPVLEEYIPGKELANSS